MVKSYRSVVSGVRVLLDGSAVDPVENLGEENDLDNFFEESPAEEDGAANPVTKFGVPFLAVNPVAEGGPVAEEGSHDGESNHIFEDDSHEIGIEKGNH